MYTHHQGRLDCIGVGVEGGMGVIVGAAEIGVGVDDATAVGVGLGLLVGVSVGVGEEVAVGVGEAVGVTLVGVGVAELVGVGVRDGDGGACVQSRALHTLILPYFQ
jgi:hypothetical protein